MKLIALFISLSFILNASDILVCQGENVLKYDKTKKEYLGVHTNFKKGNSIILTPSAILKRESGDILVGGSPLFPVEGKFLNIVKIDKENSYTTFYSQSKRNEPLSSVKKMLEFKNKKILILSNYGEVFLISKDGKSISNFFLEGDTNKVNKNNIKDIALYKEGVLILTTDPLKKALYYKEDSTFVENLEKVDSDDIDGKKVDNPNLLLIIGEDIIVFTYKKAFKMDENFRIKKELNFKGLMNVSKIIKTDEGYICIDKGRVRDDSYDDNIELFDNNGNYLKSIGTFKDGTLLDILY